MSLLIRDRNLFPMIVHAGISGNFVLGLIFAHTPIYMMILLGMLVPFPLNTLFFSNKYYKALIFKDEESELKGKIWGKNVLIYFLFLIGIILLVTAAVSLQERFSTVNYYGIFILIVNIIYWGALFLLFLRKISCK